MNIHDADFSPVKAIRLRKHWWLARTPDNRLAWFGSNPFDVIRRAQTYLKGVAK